jgi:hypothetical protein
LKSLSWCLIVAGVWTAFATDSAVAQGAEMATVKVIVFDTLGSPIPGARITLTSVGPKQTFTATGGKATLDQVPFGLYDMEIRLLGFVTRAERVRIYQSSVLFNVGLELAANHSYERAELSGAVKDDVKGRSNLWVRLVALYSSDLVENAVDSAGHFELDGMAHGKYLLILLEGNKVLATKSVELLGGKQTVKLVLESK